MPASLGLTLMNRWKSAEWRAAATSSAQYWNRTWQSGAGGCLGVKWWCGGEKEMGHAAAACAKCQPHAAACHCSGLLSSQSAHLPLPQCCCGALEQGVDLGRIHIAERPALALHPPAAHAACRRVPRRRITVQRKSRAL